METHPRDEELFRHIDHALSEEALLIAGLDRGIEQGWLTEDEKHAWLNEFIDKRNAEPNNLTQRIIESVDLS